MRIYFENVTRPKRFARNLQDVFPLAKLSEAQQWAAQVYGYRDWHDLEDVTQAQQHPASPYDEDLPEPERSRRSSAFLRRYEDIFDLDILSVIHLVGLNPTSKRMRPRLPRAKNAPQKGLPMFEILKVACFDTEARPGTCCYDSDERIAYSSSALPETVLESAIIAKLLAAMTRRKLHCPSFADDAQHLLDALAAERMADGPVRFEFDVSEFNKNDATLVQTCERVVYAFDSNMKPCGFVAYHMEGAASNNTADDNSFALVIYEAWAGPKDGMTWLALMEAVSSDFTYALQTLFFAHGRHSVAPIRLEMTNESEYLFAESAFLAGIQDLITDGLDITADYLDFSHDL